MLVYREKSNLLHQLHPVTNLAFTGVVLVLSLTFSHPLFLLGLLLTTGMAIIAAGHWEEWLGYLKFSLTMIAMLMIINVLFVHIGDTVLWQGPLLPLVGRLNITLEALAFSGGMGIRLLVIVSIFCYYTYAIHPDKVLKVFSKWGNKLVLVITLSTRLFPLMVQDYLRIIEVQRCRGVKFSSGRWLPRMKKLLPVISILLISCLERSQQMAESMHARGYGSGTRTIYNREMWRPRDYAILTAITAGLICGLSSTIQGWAVYVYYPHMVSFRPEEIKMAGVIVLLLMIPAVLNWGWMHCQLLRSRI